jgi:purine-binding chemotaxis protein CheW
MKLTNRIEENQYVVFKLNDEFYGIDIYNVKSIERIFSFTRVPNAPSYVKGVINLRGEVVPVIDLRKRFGFNSKEIDKDSRIIIVNYDEAAVGLLVDSSSEVVQLNKEEIDNVPAVGDSLKQYFVDSIGKKDERLIMLLNLEKILEVKGCKENES